MSPNGGPVRHLHGSPRAASHWSLPASLVLICTVAFGATSAHNAAVMSPTWGMDLAFFTQLIHSAAQGGPYASDLLLEPVGFFEMVHTHAILPVVMLAYRAWPAVSTLLYAHAGMASLALYPAFRLGERAGGGRLAGLLAAAALALNGLFQGAAISDMRPSVLFFPGCIGLYAAMSPGPRGRPALGAALAWALLANAGRQEASYLVPLAAAPLIVLPFAGSGWIGLAARRRAKAALALTVFGLLTLAIWAQLKPTFFYYIDPRNLGTSAALSPDHLADRLAHVGRFLRSGLPLGLLAPAPLISAAPVLWQMAGTAREWGPVTGPAAHYPAIFLPFLYVAAVQGAARLGRPGLGLLAALSTLAFPWPGWRAGQPELRALTEAVPPEAAVAADYATIHAVAGRAVLWNSAQLRMRADERPRGWSDPWPIPPETVDLILAPADDPIHALLDADPVNRWADRAPPPRGDCGGCAGTFTHRLRAKRPRGG